jgi:hypothetical protein
MTDNAVHARLLRQFDFRHLPLELQAQSQPFANLAQTMVDGGQDLDPADVTVALRKLLEAKDAYVRAALS